MPETAPHIFIDGSNWIHRLYHAMPEAARVPDQFRRWLATFMATFRPQSLRIALDATGDNWRSDLCPEYKAQRAKKPDDLRRLLDTAETWLKSWDWAKVPGHEADDLLATWTWKAKMASEQVVIASADRDLFQCVHCEHVAILRGFSTGKVDGARRVVDCDWMNYTRFAGEYQIVPPQWPEYRALVGDSSDNLGGVKGIGPKVAAALLRSYPTIEDFLKADARFATTPLTQVQTKRIRAAHESGDIAKWTRIHTLVKNAPEAGS
jgi:DNA polymerase-1